MPEVFFNGPEGRIEGKYNESKDKKAKTVLVLHPHPQYGGTMNNKVVYSIYKSFVQSGFTALRINFRGVGRSEGVFDSGIGELADAATALDWIQLNNPMSSGTWIAGFSFGAWIGMQLIMRRPEIENFIAVSPPVNKYDFGFLSPCPIPGVFVQGNQDSVVPEESVVEFVEKISKQRQAKVHYQSILGADHFFRGKLENLEEAISDYILKKPGQMSEITSAKVQSSHQTLLLD